MSTRFFVNLPPQFAAHLKVASNTVHQYHRPPSSDNLPVRPVQIEGNNCFAVTRDDGSEVLVVPKGVSAAGLPGDVLQLKVGILTEEILAEENPHSWINIAGKSNPVISSHEAASSRADEVRGSWVNRFFYRQENPHTNEDGLRPPQIGAVHATLAHWTVAPHEPATIAMPTGTGKTETMLALLINQRMPCVLVLVPNSALRSQITEKFLGLGVLKKAEVVHPKVLYPIVGLVEHQFPNAETATMFLRSCNVVVATMDAINGSSEEVQRKFAETCSHLFIDEAHHVRATTWDGFRRRFHGKPITQFTATPFREDGKHVGGRMIYSYPLRKAQEEGYFKPIRFRSVFTYTDSDRTIAEAALTQLREDLAVSEANPHGFDHLIMARVKSIDRAIEVHALYQELAPEFAPLHIFSTMTQNEKREALRLLRRRSSRIIVCVNMLGEGFDLPQLKIAALHDIHKSLAITLQFTGRFTRTLGRAIPPVGDATMVANRAQVDVREELRALYAEDADWDRLIRELGEGATNAERERSEFQRSFGVLPSEVPLQNVEPKMSSVVYRMAAERWNPDAIETLFPEEMRYTKEIARSEEHRVAWFVTKEVNPVTWGEMHEIENTTYHLYLIHCDEEQCLLFINSSNNGSLHPELAVAVGGEGTEIIEGDVVYRCLHNINRMRTTNLGLLDLISRTRRFTMYTGADTTEGLDPTQSNSKTKTNIFGHGYEAGEEVSIGCSLKGRIWSFLVVRELSDWLLWCRHVGTKLLDEAITSEEIFKNFVRPEPVRARPLLVPLAVEWPRRFLAEQEDRVVICFPSSEISLHQVSLEIVDPARDTPIRFRVVAEGVSAEYELVFGEKGTRYVPTDEEVDIRIGRTQAPLSEWFRRNSPKVHFEQDTFIEDDYLLCIDRALPAFDMDKMAAWDWTGVNIKKESQGPSRAADTVQRRVMERLLANGNDWDIIFDDDDAGEVADVVAMRTENNRLIVHLYHCKYSKGENAGSRVEDFYAVCGQAQKSVHWREKSGLSQLVPHLVRREQQRLDKGLATRFEKGGFSILNDIGSRLEILTPEFSVFVVQPGLSKVSASSSILELLAATSLYLRETFNVDFGVVVSS